ncbi:MAG TPA: M48 family metallopeptidase, partial [Allosphingosinicella sp.]|nr:M48 family metallopeptidase [Allosphingosinicella sp.]
RCGRGPEGGHKILIRHVFLYPALAALLAPAAPAAGPAQAPGSEATRVASPTLDQRVAAIGYRLATANRARCADHQFLPGFSVHDLSQYDAAERGSAAIRELGFEAGPAVLTLIADGPADRAGLRVDDVLLGADGTALPHATVLPARGSYAQMEQIHGALEAAFADGRSTLVVRRRGAPLSLTVEAVAGCASRFEMIPGRSLNAKADGRYVQVTIALAQYAAADEELAAILAHEFAHNILRHRARLDAAGVRRGVLGNFGRNARLTRETELEADRLAPYLLDRAGYDPEAAVRFWRRLGNRGFNIFGSPTHGGWGSRIEAIQGEIARIRRARTAGSVSEPDFVRLPLS